MKRSVMLEFFGAMSSYVLFIFVFLSANVSAQSYLYTANVCQRGLVAMRIEKDGLVSRLYTMPSVAHNIVAAKNNLYISNAGWNNDLQAIRTSEFGDVTEINLLNEQFGFASSIAMHPRGIAFYRGTKWDLSTYEMYPDRCLQQNMLEGNPGLWWFSIDDTGALEKPVFYPSTPTSLAVSIDGRLLFVGRGRQIDVHRLRKNGEIGFPAVHSVIHFADSLLLAVVQVGDREFLLSLDGESALTVFEMNIDGSLSERSVNSTQGYQPRAILTQALPTGEVNVYIANKGHHEYFGNNIAVFRLSAKGDLIPLQVVSMLEEKGDSLYYRPSGLVATSSHLYVTNFGRALFGAVQEGSVMVFSLNEEGLLITPHLQEVGTSGNGTASPVIVNR